MKEVDTIVTKAIQIFNSALFWKIIQHHSRFRGGCFVVLDNSDEIGLESGTLVEIALGSGSIQHRSSCRAIAHRTASRIKVKGTEFIVSSWQHDRNPSEERYGGAICAGNYILSFHGLSEEVDEIFVLLVATAAGLLDINAAAVITSHSGNKERFESLLLQFGAEALRDPVKTEPYDPDRRLK